MATQQDLGVHAQYGLGFAGDHHRHTVADGAFVMQRGMSIRCDSDGLAAPAFYAAYGYNVVGMTGSHHVVRIQDGKLR